VKNIISLNYLLKIKQFVLLMMRL